MDVLSRLNDAIAYVESHLCDNIDFEEISRIALYTPDGFNRLFSYIASISLNEYIRRRRLTLSAYELRDTNNRIIDIATKYSFNSSDAFTKAFIRQHGMTPSAFRLTKDPLKVYPPISFHVLIKGAKEMNFRIVETSSITLVGLSKVFIGKASDRFPQEHLMWADHHDDFQNQICKTIPGTWYGIWDNGIYWIAKLQEDIQSGELDVVHIKGGKYAAFTTELGGYAGDLLPKLRELIFDSWLEDSGYVQTNDYEIEIYHLFSKSEKEKRYYEIWIPIENKERR